MKFINFIITLQVLTVYQKPMGSPVPFNGYLFSPPSRPYKPYTRISHLPPIEDNAVPDLQANDANDALVKTVSDLPLSVAIKLAPYADNAIGYFDKTINILDQIKALAFGFGVNEAVKTIEETAGSIKKSARSTAAMAKDAKLSAVEKIMAVCINYSKYIKTALSTANAINSQFLYNTANIWLYELGQVSQLAETNAAAAKQIVDEELKLLNTKFVPSTTTAATTTFTTTTTTSATTTTTSATTTTTSTTTTTISTTTTSTTTTTTTTATASSSTSTTTTTTKPETIEIQQEIRENKIEKISQKPKLNKPFKFRLFPSKKNFGNRRKVSNIVNFTTEKPTTAFTTTNTPKVASTTEKSTPKSLLKVIAEKKQIGPKVHLKINGTVETNEIPQLFHNFPQAKNKDSNVIGTEINENSIVSALQEVFNPTVKADNPKPKSVIENLLNQKLNFQSLLESSQKTNSERTKSGADENFSVSCTISCTAVVCVQKCTVCNVENCTSKSIQ